MSGSRSIITKIRRRVASAPLIAVALIFGVIGVVVLGLSRAATPTASLEVESGTRTTNATSVSDATASGSNAVKFAASTGGARTCPAYPSFPDASCTGFPAGTALTVKSGNQTINTAGTVIDGWDVRGKLIINAANVTVKNSIVHGPAAGGCSNGASIEMEGDNITIQDTEVVVDNQTACLDGVWMDGNFGTLTRVHVHGGTDGVKAGNDPSAHDYLIQDSYIHGMVWNANDPNQGGTETHNDGIQSWSGVTNVTVRHNNIDLSTVRDSGGNIASNAAWQSGVFNARVENNYLDGGGCTLNFASSTSTASSKQQPIYINNNHFGRNRGFTGCVVLINNNAVMTEYNGNVYQDNGQAVPTWQQHN